MSDIQKLLGDNIKYYRKQRNIQQSELAKIIGIDQANLSKIENGKTDLVLSSIKKIADGLNISSSQLLANREDGQTTIFEKLLQLESINKSDQKIIINVINVFLEKNRLEKLQDVKMKKRLTELERVHQKL
jgi:transcriptional regulator with XRE-family HTH domain